MAQSEMKKKNEKRKKATYRVALMGIMTALAEVLMLLEVPLPLMPGFLKYDFSDIPALFAGLALGPVAGVIVEFLKNLLHMPFTNTQYIGEVANFICGSSFVFIGALIYSKKRNIKGIILSLIFGTLALTVAAGFVNYFFNLPLYEKVMGFPTAVVIDLCDTANVLATIDSKLDVILMTFVPFNLFKGITISFVTFLVYLAIQGLLDEKDEEELPEGEGGKREEQNILSM